MKLFMWKPFDQIHRRNRIAKLENNTPDRKSNSVDIVTAPSIRPQLANLIPEIRKQTVFGVFVGSPPLIIEKCMSAPNPTRKQITQINKDPTKGRNTDQSIGIISSFTIETPS
jgi:hypothetical protein